MYGTSLTRHVLHGDVINADLLAFLKAERVGEGRVKKETGVREAAVIGG